MANVILIDPRGWQGAVNGNVPFPNVGLAYLISTLHKNGHDVFVIDLNNESLTNRQVLQIIEGYKPDIIGLSVKTSTMKDARSLSKQIKDSFPKIHVILGGPHTKFEYERLITEPWFDIVFVGEGEYLLPLICVALSEGSPVENIQGVVTKHNLKKDFCLDRSLITGMELDNLPFPEYELFPENVRESLYTAYPLVTSRGCVYNCSYCSVPEISGKGFRKRSPENIIEELKWAQHKYRITGFWIIDDVFNLDIKRSKQICHALIEADLNMVWSCPNGLRADRVDPELAGLMFESGCRSVSVGVESADPDILKTVKKGETIEDIEKGIKTFKKSGIDVNGFFIVGLPGDSFQAERRSVEFVKKLGINALFNMLVPYPGTELWDWAKINAKFLGDPEDGLHFSNASNKVKSIIETVDFSASDRQESYEMVNTKLRRFDVLVPGNIPRWKYMYQVVTLLWKYDRSEMLSFFFKKILKKIQPPLKSSKS
ncbi:MAG: B12-binding domain-containing radical SAM protein [Deltaproteobacteria bacterium]|nr:B12-binding domain-containing radical SAM protein [Deltaproteobacteria bacterium]